MEDQKKKNKKKTKMKMKMKMKRRFKSKVNRASVRKALQIPSFRLVRINIFKMINN